MWQSAMVLGQDHWEIDLVINTHETEEQAILCASKEEFSPRLVIHDNDFCLEIKIDGVSKYYRDKDIVVTEISKEKRALLGMPLDPSNPDDFKHIQESLDAIVAGEAHPRIVNASDMVPSSLRLEHLIIMYGVGSTVDHLAWGVDPVPQPPEPK